MTINGIHFSNYGQPDVFTGISPAEIAAYRNDQFVGLYIGQAQDDGYLRPNDVSILEAQGLSIVSIFERGSPENASYFETQALTDAQDAISAASSAGQPYGTVIYFTIDYQVADSTDIDAIKSYFETINSYFLQNGSPYQIGAYGGGNVLSALVNDPNSGVKYTWLASNLGADGYTGANIVQTSIDPSNHVPGSVLSVDLDIAKTQDYGQWGISDWDSGVNGDFSLATNWTNREVPEGETVARITPSGTYTVTSFADETVASLTTAKGATLAINNGTFAITNGTGPGANAGAIAVGDGAILTLGGTIKNSGVISLNSVFVPTSLVLTADVNLQGSGELTLSDSSQNAIAAATGDGPVTLTNVGNTISGAGLIGSGDGELTLINNKTIDATGTNNALVIDTGATVSNTGTLESTSAPGLTLEDDIDNTGGLVSAAGPVAGLVGIEVGVVSGVINLESPGVEAPGRRPRHEECYQQA